MNWRKFILFIVQKYLLLLFFINLLKSFSCCIKKLNILLIYHSLLYLFLWKFTILNSFIGFYPLLIYRTYIFLIIFIKRSKYNFIFTLLPLMINNFFWLFCNWSKIINQTDLLIISFSIVIRVFILINIGYNLTLPYYFS